MFSRRAEGFAVKEKSAEVIVEIFKKSLNKWGRPKRLLPDNGLEFRNNLLEELCRNAGI